MNELHQVMHGLAVKKHAKVDEVAKLVDKDPATVSDVLSRSEKEGRVIEVGGKYTLSPLGRIALDSEYSREYDALRQNRDFIEAYEAFEKINTQLKALITDWQTMEVGGERVANDHSNKDHDMEVIDRLGDLHEKADRILARLEAELPRIAYYRDGLLSALERAEDGDIEWVSDAKIPSYHTLWFELHEDLLRLLGRIREE